MKKNKKFLFLALIFVLIFSTNVWGGTYKDRNTSSSKVTLKLNKIKASMYPTTKLQLKVGGNKGNKVVWKSSNTAYGTVNTKGQVTAKKKRTFYITASCKGKSVKCKITVKNDISAFKRDLPKVSWWSKGFKYSFGISGNNVVIGNTYGKTVKKCKINYVQKTAYGYFINIAGYNNYRWYRSKPNALECYSSATGNRGHKNAGRFVAFGC